MSPVDGIRCMLMRGGTSKGAYFLASDVPDDPAERDDLMLRIMGSPDPRQIDGLGSAHPTTSKVAIVSRSMDAGADVDYLFLQIGVDDPHVSDAQTCGNLLSGVGPFAIERGLIPAEDGWTPVRIRMLNTGGVALTHIFTPGGIVDYEGETAIDGVPGTARGIDLEIGAESSILPTGNITDEIDGHTVSLVNNGMPVVLLRADEFEVVGTESPAELEARADLAARVESIRRAAGPLMGFGDVADKTVPQMFLLSPARAGGAISTRAFVPHTVHPSIGVLMAATVAAGIRIPGAVGSDLAEHLDADPCLIEHPGGVFPSRVTVEQRADGQWYGTSTSLRTARKIFDGLVFPRPRR